jgi:hypothetical protein
MNLNHKIITDILLAAAIFGFAWLMLNILFRKGINYVNNFVFVTAYFAVFSMVFAWVFANKLRWMAVGFPPKLLILVASVLALNFVAYYLGRKFLKKPRELIRKNPYEYNILMDYRYILPKAMEIFFQQIFIMLLTLAIFDAGFGLGEAALAFALIFGALHIPLIKSTGKFFGEYYSAFAAVSGVIFPILIIKVEYGFVYTFAIHMLFYIVSAAGFWAYFGGKKRNA